MRDGLTTVGITPLPFETLPVHSRKQGQGSFLVYLGVAMIIVGFIAPMAALEVMETGGDAVVALAFVVLFFAGVYGGVQIIGIGRRMRAIPAEQQLEDDNRPPVLYLRSFEDDDLLDPTPRMIPMGDFFPRRYEESLVKPLQKIGPMLSIGRPGNKLPMLGGARLFVDDQNWQQAVDHLRRHASAVVLMIGRTEGLWWEIESSVREVAPEKLLFFFPYVEESKRRVTLAQRLLGYRPAQMPLSKKAYQRMEAERMARYRLFRERMGPLLSAEFPAELGNSQFLDIDRDGQVRVLRTYRPWWQFLAFLMPSMRMMTINLRRTLKPYVRKLTDA